MRLTILEELHFMLRHVEGIESNIIYLFIYLLYSLLAISIA